MVLVGLLVAAYAARSSGLVETSPYPSARVLAEALGCTPYTAGVPAPALGVSVAGAHPQPQFGSCTFRGHRTVVGWSGTNDAAYAYFSLGSDKRDGRTVLHGTGWSVGCATVDDCQAAQGLLGGELG